MIDDSCALCKSNVITTFSAPDNRDYCVTCIKKMYPPYMSFLVFDTKPPNIWNIETGKHEKIGAVADLNMCGWEIKMMQELPTGSVFVYMEYFGDSKCGRCSWYEWGLTGTRCLAQMCEQQVDRRPAVDMVYPNRNNIYLNWKYGRKKC